MERSLQKVCVDNNYRTHLLCLLVMAITFNHQTVQATLLLQGSFNVDQIYTDNLFFRDRDKREDFGTYVGPNLMLLYENPDIVLGAAYFGRMLFFLNNPGQNRYVQNANILLDLPFLKKRYQKLSVQVHERMNFTPQLDPFFLSEAQDDIHLAGTIPNNAVGGAGGGLMGGGDLTGSGFGGGGFGAFGGTQGIFTQRASAFINNAGLTVGYEWTPQMTPRFSYTNYYLRFFTPGFQDHMTHTGTFFIPYRISQRLTVTPLYQYRQTEFLGPSTQFTFANRIIFHDSTLEISYALTPSWTIAFRGGVSFFKQEGATETISSPNGPPLEREITSDFVGRPIGSISVNKTYERGLFSITAAQQTGSGGGLGAQATRSRSITTRLVHQLSMRSLGFISGAYARNESVGGSAFDATTFRGQMGYRYTFLRWLFGTVSYNYIEQRSKTLVAPDLTVNLVFLSLSAVADPWYFIR